MAVTIRISRGTMGQWCIWLMKADGRRYHIASCRTKEEAQSLVAEMQQASVVS